MKKIFLSRVLLISGILLLTSAYAALAATIFDVVVTSNVTDSWDYDYTLTYPYYSTGDQMRNISHWWLEINCAHFSIDESSIYGYTEIGDVQYDWPMSFHDKDGETGSYTDWVIKWDTPDWDNLGIDEPEPVPGGIIGYFGFHSSNSPTTGNWGAKDGKYDDVMLFDYGTTQIPHSGNCVIPEPTSLSLLGLGLLGLFGIGRKKRS